MPQVESRSLELRAVALGAWALALVASILRVYARAFIMKAFAADDWLMMVSMFAFTVNTITCVLGTFYGSGMHLVDLSTENIETALMWWFACYPSIAVTLAFSKISVACYLLRIATQRIHRWIIYLALGATILTSVVFFFVTLLQCNPIPYAWQRITGTGTCIGVDTVINIMYAYSSLTLFADLAFTLLPAWLVFHLQMSLKTKLALTLVLGMASIASVAVILRFPHLADFRNPDYLFAPTTVSIWTQLEASLSIAAGSFATLRPLFRILLVKLGLTTDTVPTYGRHGPGGDHNYHASSGGGVGGGSAFTKSRATARNMFSMNTFNRMDDDATTDADDDSTGRREGSLGSTADLHNKTGSGVEVSVARRDDRVGDYTVQIESQRPAKGKFRSSSGGGDVAAGAGHHQRDASDHKVLEIHYTKEFGSGPG
ncbi:uncharacterized protein B0I36DRAFT_163974 [Microdochium trichocladiopsis]|uniref:Rhodopsin domain-containing protein n=1 Tax=Microdochium trichocladiopsis TaxID=1682393 RepID=A0A9P8Y0S2_9PEZI|nr:uncharacterized protein B0I36DRAFT_163974 [Microdochium trichocladiopsis]KAH7024727.1 hypothetical protein B0I36DRAFT_163974 [Microdochium trichocladiopsis]